jgi:hypothetical protein
VQLGRHHAEQPATPAGQRQDADEAAASQVQPHAPHTQFHIKYHVGEQSSLLIGLALKLLAAQPSNSAARTVRADEPPCADRARPLVSSEFHPYAVAGINKIRHLAVPRTATSCSANASTSNRSVSNCSRASAYG